MKEDEGGWRMKEGIDVVEGISGVTVVNVYCQLSSEGDESR
jgi:hypothetical protein